MELEKNLARLPEQTRWVSGQLLAQLDFVEAQVRQLEQRLEIGEVQRFPSAMHLASYAGTTPRVHASGGKVRYAGLRNDVNRYLKWAFAEAANSVAVNHRRCPERHVSQLYQRLRLRKGHAKAVGAVARHLAEAAFHLLQGKEMYRDPVLGRGRTSEV